LEKAKTYSPVNTLLRDYDVADASAVVTGSLVEEIDGEDQFLSLFSDSSSVSDE
jgi:hypothetical protein